MKYFATDSRAFPDHGIKLKSGSTHEMSAETAAVYNGIHPGILVPYVPETHTPPPVEQEPVVDPAPVDPVVSEKPEVSEADAQVTE